MTNPDIQFIISRQVLKRNYSGALPFDGHPEETLKMTVTTAIYKNDPCSVDDFTKSFGRYGIPGTWSVTAVPEDTIYTFHNYFDHRRLLIPAHLHDLMELPPVLDHTGSTRLADWRADFQQCFNLDRDFEPNQ